MPSVAVEGVPELLNAAEIFFAQTSAFLRVQRPPKRKGAIVRVEEKYIIYCSTLQAASFVPLLQALAWTRPYLGTWTPATAGPSGSLSAKWPKITKVVSD